MFTPNIIVFDNQFDQFTPFLDNNLVQFEKGANATLILTLKGVSDLNLEEIQLLHQLIYRTVGGFLAIEIGILS